MSNARVVVVGTRDAGVVGIVIEARRHVVGQKNVVHDNSPDNFLAVNFGRDDISDNTSSTTTFPTTFLVDILVKTRRHREMSSKNG